MIERLASGGGSVSNRRGPKVAAVTVVVAVVLSAPAFAHSELRTSRPVDGQTVRSPLAQVDLVFWESVSGSVVTVRDPQGSLVPGHTNQVDDVTVRFAMAPTTVSGRYLVDYRLTSPDGDQASGFIAFTYAPTSTSLGAVPAALLVSGLAVVAWASRRVMRRR